MEIPTPFWRIHGVVRGLYKAGHSELFEGRFGRMFRALPAARHSEGDLHELAVKMVAPADTPGKESDDPPDDEENFGGNLKDPTISAGYTYLGQFIDHDLTFDPSSSLEKQNDPEALVDFRTPRFDLDNIYGRGPDDQPYLYQEDGVRMQLGRPLNPHSGDPQPRDLPRNSPTSGGARRALIGDPRNDENVIVSQLQATFLRFHNKVANVMRANKPDDFMRVQQQVRWHYQWVVVNDFLPTILDADTLNDILPHLAKWTSVADDPPRFMIYKPRKDPFIPVEFSVAAYRFGHSMVRPIYRLNENVPAKPDGDRLPIFTADGTPSLVGFREIPADFAIDWRLFFKLGDSEKGPKRIQPAYKIDTSIVNPLGALPVPVINPSPHVSLAERNLLRGLSMGLPSGQAVAEALGIPAVPDDELQIGKANESDFDKNPLLVSISDGFKRNAPLWYYILAESQQAFRKNKKNDTPIHLGPVGSRIVGEVFAGILTHDPHSYFKQCPRWKPFSDFTSDGTSSGEFGIAELIKQALTV